MKVFLLSIFNRVLIISLLANLGCYNYYRGGLHNYDIVKNSEVLRSSSLAYSISSMPVFGNPVLTLQFRYIGLYDYRAVENYTELRQLTNASLYIPRSMIIVGVASAVVGAVIAVDSGASEDKKRTGLAVLGGGIAVGLLGSILRSDGPIEATEKIIVGDTVSKTKTSEPEYLVADEFYVTINGRSRIYRTNSKGEISIDLSKEFNLDRFEKIMALYVQVQLSDKNSNISALGLSVPWEKTIDINSTAWTKEFCEIVADEIKVFNSPGTSGKNLGVCKITEKYPIIPNANAEWTHIKYYGVDGWISSFAGKRIWLAK